ncbi:MAG: hypothetical protein HUU54_01800 [Ignavibacteriaceae bacterium]|nr:hypothetical protein [Ignavibacteriaceae bacterium]
MNYSLRTFLNLSFFLCLFLVAGSQDIQAQVSNTISKINFGPAKEGEDVSVEVELLQNQQINRINFYYRNSAKSEFTEIEMELMGMAARCIIPGEDVTLPYVEYYVVVQTAQGEDVYPGLSVEPLKLIVQAGSPKDKEVIVMAPEKNSSVSLDEFFVSISLLRASDAVDKSKTKIFIDGADVTEMAVFADDIIIYVPENFGKKISLAGHNLRIELYDTQGNLYHTVESAFSVVQREVLELAAGAFKYRGEVNAESRREDVRSVDTWYNNMRITSDGSFKNWNFSGNVYVTSEEKKHLQPNNRYSLNIRSSWLDLNFGDHNPRFPSLIMSGKRVRGVTGGLYLGYFNLDFTTGQVSRPIEGTVQNYITIRDTIGGSIVEIDSAKYGFPRASLSSFGTYERDVFAIRPSFGKGQNFQWGLTYLHSSDDPKSIAFSAKPKENIVLGTDLMIGFDDQKVLFTAQGAFNLINNDISGGNFTDAQLESFIKGIDSTMLKDLDTYKSARDLASKFITVNQFIGPLNPQELPTVAGDAALQLSYFNNFLKVSYQYRGNEYTSFGSSFLRNDVAGFTIYDRLRLFENTLFLSGTFESLSDNLQETKFATTNFTTWNTSISYYPRTNLPNVIASIGQSITENGLDTLTSALIINDPTKKSLVINDVTDKYYLQLGYDFFFKYKHQTSVSFNYTDRQDDSPGDYDVTSLNLNLSASTAWAEKFSSNFSFILSQTDLKGTPFNYVTLSLGGRYYMMNDKLVLNSSINPSFGDFKRVYADFYAQYFWLRNLSLMFQTRFIANSASGGIPASNDLIVGLSTRYTF